MKYMDYAAMGTASDAYAEASRAQSGVEQLWNEINQIKDKIGEIQNDNNQRAFYEAQQAWIEELIYQFNKVVAGIMISPREPVVDYRDLMLFLSTIYENQINTSVIRGLENKYRFERLFQKAQELQRELQKDKSVVEYILSLDRQRAAAEEMEKIRKKRQKKNWETWEAERIRKKIRSMFICTGAVVFMGVSFFLVSHFEESGRAQLVLLFRVTGYVLLGFLIIWTICWWICWWRDTENGS